MGVSLFQRLGDWLTYGMSAWVTSIGVMTLNEKMALAGMLVGLLFGARGWLHRVRMERGLARRNDLIAQILAQASRRPLSHAERQSLSQLQQDVPDDETGY
ncbi:hypothetical protein [Candidatus Sodalis pierantonius]|uniref:hypothetical protein n=1 Tax=Candidatus Sodalis pierantonii TaxID=1486991 RepID=UPI00046D1A34|nr:hypothetical protein [Candidatus Sodalis pierantonius]